MKFSTALYVAFTATTMAAPIVPNENSSAVIGADDKTTSTLFPVPTNLALVNAASKKELLAAIHALARKQHNDKQIIHSNTTDHKKNTNVQVNVPKLSEWEQKMLDSQNKKRSLHQDTGALEWSEDLKHLAQKYVDKYDCSGNMAHHDEYYEIGENLAIGYDDVDAVEAWYDEIKFYDYNNPVYQSSAGHFTQMVWRNTTRMGCAYKTCGGDLYNYIVCEYYEAGNWDGEFSDNVKPLK